MCSKTDMAVAAAKLWVGGIPVVKRNDLCKCTAEEESRMPFAVQP
jgi:hypothetical protein